MTDHSKPPHPSLPPAVIAAQARQAADRPEAERTRPAQFGGVRLKLTVPTDIPGYHLYWANDDGEVDALIEEGFELVRPEEMGTEASRRIQRRVVQDEDIANSYSRHVGTKEDGSSLRAYLLKIPNEQWEDRQAMKLAQADAWDGAIRKGAIENVDGRYVPRGHEIKLNTRNRES
jgi:hypothetical protein